jgi:hypothetical protein
MNLEGVDIFQARRSGERPKCRLNFDTALRYDCCVAGDRLRIVMSSIMRRRRGLISAIGNLLSEGLGCENPRSSQTGGDHRDRFSTAASAASFNPKSIQHKLIPL